MPHYLGPMPVAVPMTHEGTGFDDHGGHRP